MKTKIERMEDDLTQYTITQGLELAEERDYLGISAFGDVKTLMQFMLNDVKVVYQRMLEKDVVDILIYGTFDGTQMERLVRAHLPFAAHKQEIKISYKVQNQLHDERKTEYRNITQNSIMVVWLTNTAINNPGYYVLHVTDTMFGQYSTSLLFQGARKKNSLCYPVYSNLISYDAALGITAGMERERIDKTISSIHKQFQRTCEDDFTSDLLEVSKRMIVNSLRASKDSTNSLIVLQYQDVLLDRQWDTEDIIERIQAVKREDILHVMQACELRTTFVLAKEDANENNHE